MMHGAHASAEQHREKREEFLAGQLLVVDLVSDSTALRTHGIVLNISKSGMAVQTFRPLVQGHVAEIQLSLSGVPLAAGEGMVAWQKQGGVAGIRFLNAPLKSLAERRQWIQVNAPRQNSDSALPLFSYRDISSANEFDTTLHLFACSAMALTGATGAAIALGNISGMECRASVGGAPQVGTRLLPNSGVSGHSMRTGSVILCNDAWSDSRVNTAAAQQMDTRSFVIVPIVTAGDVVGLFEAFSRDTNYFTEKHVQQLQPLVNVLAEAIHEQASESEAPVANAAVNSIETFRADESATLDFAAYSEFSNRSQMIAVAFGVLAALLAFIVVVAMLTSRDRAKSPGNSNSSVNTQNGARQPNPGASKQGAVSTAKPLISFDPSLIDQKIGATFSVDVVLKGANNVWSAPMQILYDPQKLQVITVRSGNMLNRDGQAATLVQRVDSSTGRINVSISRPLSAPGISGDGVVFTLVFLSKALGSSKLRVDQTGLRDTSTRVVSIDSSDAIVTISASTNPAGRIGDRDAVEARTLPAAPVAMSSGSNATIESVPEAGVEKSAEAIPNTKTSLIVDGPPGTQIFVDDQASSNITTDGSARIPYLSPGQHHLRLALQGYQDYDELINVVPGKTLRISDALVPVLPLAKSTELKLPAVNAAIALVPRPPRLPSFVLDRTFKAHTNWVTTIAFSSDGQRLVSGSWDRSVKSWDVATGHELSAIASKVTGIQASALSHDGRLIAAEDASNDIRIWNATTGGEVRAIKGDRPPWDESWVYSIAFSPDDSLLAAALDNKTVRLWNVNSGRVVRDFVASSREVIYAAFSPNGRWLATGGDARTIEIWDTATGKVSKTLKGHKQDVYAVAFSPDGRWLASASKDKTVKVWEVATGREVHTLTGHQSSVTSLAFSPNSRWLATSGWDKTVRIWEVEAGREIQTLTGHTHQIYSLAFDSRGGWLATGSADGTINLWRLRKEIDLAVLGEPNNASATAPSVASTGRPK
jgi:WD40 repeat protein